MLVTGINSTSIESVGFEENFKMAFGGKEINIMRIIFKTGNTFDYYGVDKKVYEEFLKSESKGKFFHANIRDKYQYEKVN